MPAVTCPEKITLARVHRDLLAHERVRAIQSRLARQSENLKRGDWRIGRVRAILAACSGGAETSWSMPVQEEDFYGVPRPYDLSRFLDGHVYLGRPGARLAFAVWETHEELHWLLDTLQRLAAHPFFAARMAMFMPALKLFELTPGEDRYFFCTFIDGG
jgi:hypothetical protein